MTRSGRRGFWEEGVAGRRLRNEQAQHAQEPKWGSRCDCQHSGRAVRGLRLVSREALAVAKERCDLIWFTCLHHHSGRCVQDGLWEYRNGRGADRWVAAHFPPSPRPWTSCCHVLDSSSTNSDA